MTKTLLSILSLFSLIPCFSQSDEYYIEFTTLYIGKDVYVQNPFKGSGTGFCVSKVVINDTFVVKDQITSSAFQISLEIFEKCKDTVNIKVYHAPDCLPKFLGPELITPKITAEFESVTITSNGLITWKTINESWIGTFHIQQWEDSVWRKVESVPSLGGECFRDNEYSKLVRLQQGENTFRVVKFLRGKPVISEEVTVVKE